ncbi:MAG: toprim domain-containing protein [Bacteroidales bacterium]|nr:toprim domain-containing protein [Bacteroidales bacterium]
MIDNNEYLKLGIYIPNYKTTGQQKTSCPKCEQEGKKRNTNLSVNLDKGLYYCHRCQFKGNVRESNYNYSQPKEELPKIELIKPTNQKIYKKPTPIENPNLSQNIIKYFKERTISEETLRQVGIYTTNHLMINTNKREEQECIVFPYYVNKELINLKYRTINKQFQLEKDCELVPFNIDSIKEEEYCIITEGEIDTLSFIEAGYNSVISVPNGASKNTNYFDRFQNEYFKNKKTIYIAVDADEKGFEFKELLKETFDKEKIKIVYYTEGIKDANEELTKNKKESLCNCINKAMGFHFIIE